MNIFHRLLAWRRMPMVDCDTVMRQLWDYLDGELTPESATAIERHLEMCKRCAPEAEFQRKFLEALARVPVDVPDVEGVRERLTRALVAHGYAPPE